VKKGTNYGSHAPDKSSNGKRQERFNDAQFVRYELDKALQASCKAWEITSDAMLDAINRLADDGYAITVKWDSYSEAYLASVRQTRDNGKNSGFVLTGRGSSGAKALKQALFKHFEVMDTDWSQYAERRGIDAIDD